jgi:hypothetical protein
MAGVESIDQVEVVGGLVDHQAAGIALVAVPAAEVVRPVGGVQQPLEVDADDVAQRAALDDLLDLRVAGGVAVVEGDGEVLAGALDRVDDLLALLGIDGHRLLADGVAAQLHGADDVAGVGAVHAGDDDGVGLLLGHHVVELVGQIGGQGRVVELLADLLVVVVHATLVHVAEGDQFTVLAEVLHEGFGEHPGTSTGADEGIPFLHREGSFCRARLFFPDGRLARGFAKWGNMPWEVAISTGGTTLAPGHSPRR